MPDMLIIRTGTCTTRKARIPKALTVARGMRDALNVALDAMAETVGTGTLLRRPNGGRGVSVICSSSGGEVSGPALRWSCFMLAKVFLGVRVVPGRAGECLI